MSPLTTLSHQVAVIGSATTLTPRSSANRPVCVGKQGDGNSNSRKAGGGSRGTGDTTLRDTGSVRGGLI
jgi:hypothetical protein